jgi:hypothetical protein
MEIEIGITIAFVAAVVIIGVLVSFVVSRKRSKRLKERFGPEYDRTVRHSGSREKAEAKLREREERVRQFDIVPLLPNDRRRYQDSWAIIQGRFVDDPKTAVEEANGLIQEVMQRRGYSVIDSEQSAADLSVDYPAVVENYRAAYQIAVRNERGVADTEELRQALVYYRALFRELLGGSEGREQNRTILEADEGADYEPQPQKQNLNKAKRGGLRI